MDANTIWGIVISAYVMAGVWASSMANNGPRPKGAVPGSSTMKQWEENEARGQKWLVAWVFGFALLMGAWWLLR